MSETTFLQQFSENLLMCAIRNKQEKMAEYLIVKGIDISYEVELFVSSKYRGVEII
jgi:hypothetical protein